MTGTSYTITLCDKCSARLLDEPACEAWKSSELLMLEALLLVGFAPKRPSASRRRKAAALAERLRAASASTDVSEAEIRPPWLPCRDCFAVLDEFGATSGALAIIGATFAARLAELLDTDRWPFDETTGKEAISLVRQLQNAFTGILNRRSWNLHHGSCE